MSFVILKTRLHIGQEVGAGGAMSRRTARNISIVFSSDSAAFVVEAESIYGVLSIAMAVASAIWRSEAWTGSSAATSAR